MFGKQTRTRCHLEGLQALFGDSDKSFIISWVVVRNHEVGTVLGGCEGKLLRETEQRLEGDSLTNDSAVIGPTQTVLS
jgi:hypothetical protein